MDAKSDAPGANMMLLGSHDGTGRIMSKRISFYLIFVAVVGEEQGLYGAKHLQMLPKMANGM
jgi:hypothetical protein